MKEYNNENLLAAKNDLRLIDFFATWCGPCQMIMPVLERLAKEETNQGVDFVKVDIDQFREVANEFQVRSVPTLVLVKDGKEVARRAGFQSKDQLEKWLNDFR